MRGASTPAAGRAAAETLAEYAVGLRFEDIPPEAVRAAKACLIDAVACAVFGAKLPWSRIVADHAEAIAAEGPCRLPGALECGLPLPQAALCLGAFSHAFELDSLRKPGSGVHPGATVALPALAAAQAVGADGKALVAAIVAGCEVLFRIGQATLHSAEGLGFHAPGITGPFGAATAAGRLLGLDATQLAQAYGVAGSLGGGLLAFARAGEGGMVKRLHLGRAAEGGVTAALLAWRGFEGPRSVLDGAFGVLHAFCERSDAALLTRGLGAVHEIGTLCIKPYACHVTAQAPAELLRLLVAERGFEGCDVEAVTLAVSDKVLSHHAEHEPRDLMLAQYSVPFCTALAAFRDPADPHAFSDDALRDADIRDLARRVRLVPGEAKGWGVRLSLRLKDGREVEAASDSFLGCPERPMSDADLAAKFARLTAGEDGARMSALHERLRRLELLEDCRMI